MLDFRSVLSGAVPAVDPRDLQRFCSFHWQQAAPSETAYTCEAIRQICQSESADPIALWARASLLGLLRQPGSPEPWREDDGWQQAVFQVVAVFPLPQGLQALEQEQFLAALPS